MNKILLLIIFSFIGIGNSLGRANINSQILKIDSISDSGIPLNKFWKYHQGDNPAWASPEYNDRNWDTISTRLNLYKISTEFSKGIAWFRLHIDVDSAVIKQGIGLIIDHEGASEIYLDGKLIKSYGKVNPDPVKEQTVKQSNIPFPLVFNRAGKHLLAVRYSNHSAHENFNSGYSFLGGFKTAIVKLDVEVPSLVEIIAFDSFLFGMLGSCFLAFSILHFLLYLFYKKEKSNLYYSIFTLSISLIILSTYLVEISTSIPNSYVNLRLEYFITSTFHLIFLALSAVLYSLFYPKFPKYFWFLAAFALIIVILRYATIMAADYLNIVTTVFIVTALIENVRVTIVSARKKKEGSMIIGIGVMFFLTFIARITIHLIIYNKINIESSIFLSIIVASILSIPLSMSIHLARKSSLTKKNLEQQLVQVEALSAKTLEQEREKKQIIEGQKEVLEIQVAERTAELSQKNKDITDSINYAKRIQEAILPSTELVYKTFKNAFILYCPKDVVSGDFYAFAEKNNKVIIAAADCTGHGVPGAFMSMIGHNLLNQIIIEKEITQPGEILNNLHEGVRNALKQHESGAETRDGMDIALCSIDLKQEELEYAGAQRPLYIIKNNSLEEISGDKHSIGGLQTEEKRSFSNHKIKLEKESTLYIFTDGFADQFGGPDGKKLMVKKLKELLLSIQEKEMKEQENYLAEYFEKWKGKNEQVDDVLVIGIRI